MLQGVQTLTFTYRNAAHDDLDPTNLTTQDIREVEITITAQVSSATPGIAPITLAQAATVELRNEIP